MKIVEPPSGLSLQALCEGRGERRQVNLYLVGSQEPGTWVLVFSDHARRVLDDEEAGQIMLALDGLEAALSGETDFDRFFPDLPSRLPSPEGRGQR
jgi:hydrogenase assembly chaperone HypC/HupF